MFIATVVAGDIPMRANCDFLKVFRGLFRNLRPPIDPLGVILQEIVILKLGGAMTTHFEDIFLNVSVFVI